MSDEADRLKLADQFDRHARHVAFGVIPIAVIAAVDLQTGWLLDDRRMDVGLLAAAAMALCGAYSIRRLARRFRAGDLPQRPSPTQLVLSLLSWGATLALIAAIGFLVGGWVLAVAAPSATILIMAVATVIGVRRRPRGPGANSSSKSS